jgi:thiol-disulfide isomerase/thioredoxin/protocatechuate 3,4-dioxygenase beta subunit
MSVLRFLRSTGVLWMGCSEIQSSPKYGVLSANRATISAACAVLMVLTACPCRGEAEQPSAAATQPATQPAAAQRALRLIFVNDKTDERVAGATGSYWPDEQTGNNIKDYATDEHGESLLTFDATARSVSFFFHKHGFVESLVELGGENSVAPLADSYTVRLQPGLKIGGTFCDNEGKPVADVKVQLTFMAARSTDRRRSSVSYGTAMTDKIGRWTFDGAPSSPSSIELFAHHPDFTLNSVSHRYTAAQFDDLLNGKLVSQIIRGVTIAGTVTDDAGKAVPGAEAASNGFGVIGSTKTDAEGHFELHGVDRRTGPLAFRADGYTPKLIDLSVVPASGELNVQLQKGRTIHGQVVDAHGNPASDIYVTVGKWRNIPRLGIGMTTDAQGKFVWNGAPDDEFTLTANKRGAFDRKPVVVKAGEDNVVLQLAPQILVRGAVVDAAGVPIKRFAVHVAAKKGSTGFSMDRSENAGRFEVISAEADSYSIRISADGYLPVDSPELTSHDDVVRFDARLESDKTGSGKTGSVLTPEGKPAVGADVVLIEKGAATVEEGVLSEWAKTSNVSTVTDASGRFTLPKRTGDIHLLFFHETGWSIIKQPANAPLDGMKLRPWCTVEGVVTKNGKPAAGETVLLMPTSHAGDTLYERQQFRYQVASDGDGRFKLSRVVDGTSEIGIEISSPMGDGRMSFAQSQVLPLNLSPGEHKTDLQIGGVGRPVIGRIIVPEDLKKAGLIPHAGRLSLVRPQFIPPPGWQDMTDAQKQPIRDAFAKGVAMREYEKRISTIMVLVNDGGTFRADDVPAGEYSLWIDVQTPIPGEPHNYRWAASAGKQVIVPEMPGGKSAEPLDAGVLELEAHHYLDVGQSVPEFSPATYDGKKLDLSACRGKYVLLDFWATWCGPCVAEFKLLDKLHQRLAGDDRFVLISVSVDDRITEPSAFLRNRPLTWLQAYAGNSTPQSAFRVFGLGPLPSNWLIGPDGKIIAKQFYDEDIEKNVNTALGIPAGSPQTQPAAGQ